MERATGEAIVVSSQKRRLKIAIDCRIPNPKQGIGTAVISLASTLSRYEGDDQEYVFLVAEEAGPWLQPYLSGPCRLIVVPAAQGSRLKSILAKSKPLRRIWHLIKPSRLAVPRSDGYIEAQNFDVVHFPTQMAYLTSVPSIYQPWDLQHLHYPEFFTEFDCALRETLYRAFCQQAAVVCLQTQWSRQDILEKYALPPEKVVVIPWGSVFQAYHPPTLGEREATATKYALPRQFFFYPASTWPHKNHRIILDAISLLKLKYSRVVQVFFTGANTEFRATLDRHAQELGIETQIHFLGFVSQQELQCLFASATAMIFASRFEGFGLPLLEAFHARTPILCSSATVLPETAQDGALYFDPDSPEKLAELMLRMLDEPGIREELIGRGTMVLSRFSMDETAAAFQRLYFTMAHAVQPSLE